MDMNLSSHPPKMTGTTRSGQINVKLHGLLENESSNKIEEEVMG
jgi:hypothetical protein